MAPARTLADDLFTGQAAKMLLVGNAGHADIPMDAPGSGLFGWLLCMLGQTVGFPVPVGGAGALSTAMARRLEHLGGQVRPARRVTVRERRVATVRTEHGDEVVVRRAVSPTCPPRPSTGGSWTDLPARLRTKMSRFEWDPGTVKVDWALDGPVPWTSAPEQAPGTVHVAETVEEVVLAGAQVGAGAVPADPFLLMGQMAAADPSRAPQGSESVWAYTHVPRHRRRRRVGHRGRARRLGPRRLRAVRRPDAGQDREVRTRLRRPGGRPAGARPRELEARNENLVGGAHNGGTASMHQQLVFRPVPGLAARRRRCAASTAIRVGAPRRRVHGACGANAARAALGHAHARSFDGDAGYRAAMSRNTRMMSCTPQDVFDVLSDGWSYATWVVGAARIRDVDEGGRRSARRSTSSRALDDADQRQHRGRARRRAAPAAAQGAAVAHRLRPGDADLHARERPDRGRHGGAGSPARRRCCPSPRRTPCCIRATSRP